MSAAMPAAQIRGRWIPWLFVGLFLLVLAVNGVMIWYALSSWTGLAANEAYDQGLTYNRNLAAAARQAQLGWRPQLTVRTDGDGAEVELAVVDAETRPVTDATVVVDFERPTFEGADFAVTLGAFAPGRYRARMVPPQSGVWNLHATIRRGEDLFVHEQRIVLP